MIKVNKNDSARSKRTGRRPAWKPVPAPTVVPAGADAAGGGSAAALFGLVLAISGAGASSFSADISGSTFDRKPFPSCGVE
jgi:hypothetical protein